MTDNASVTEWILSLKNGSAVAAQRLWERYQGELARIAKHRLGDLPRRASDHDDIVQEVFLSFFRGVEQGRFSRLDDRDDLRQILLMITDRRTKDQIRRDFADKRGGGDVRGESALAGGNEGLTVDYRIDQCEGLEPNPETVDALWRFVQSHWDVFADEALGKIAIEKFEGYTNAEIAERNQITLSAVKRKFWD